MPGAIVDQVVGGAIAHAFEPDAHAGLFDHAGVVDIVVVGVVAGGRQGAAIAAAEHDGGAAHFVDVVAHYADALSAADRDGVAAGVMDRVAGDQAIAGIADGHGRSLATLKIEPADRHVRRARPDGDERAEGRGTNDAAFWLGRRPKIERFALAVQVPFARRVEFFEQVADVVAIARADGVRGVAGQRDFPLLAIDRGDRQNVVPIVIRRKDEHFAFFGMAPLPGVFFPVAERAVILLWWSVYQGITLPSWSA